MTFSIQNFNFWVGADQFRGGRTFFIINLYGKIGQRFRSILSSDRIGCYRRVAIGFRQRPYFVEYTRSHPNSEVKRRKARSVLGWGTAREALRVLLAFCFLFISKIIEPSRDDFLILGATCQCILKAFKKPLKKQWFFEGF